MDVVLRFSAGAVWLAALVVAVVLAEMSVLERAGWAFVLVLAAGGLTSLAMRSAQSAREARRRRLWHIAGQCPGCGYDISDSSRQCPECGFERPTLR